MCLAKKNKLNCLDKSINHFRWTHFWLSLQKFQEFCIIFWPLLSLNKWSVPFWRLHSLWAMSISSDDRISIAITGNVMTTTAQVPPSNKSNCWSINYVHFHPFRLQTAERPWPHLQQPVTHFKSLAQFFFSNNIYFHLNLISNTLSNHQHVKQWNLVLLIRLGEHIYLVI